MRRAMVLLCALPLAGCGSSGPDRPSLDVSASSSLKPAFTEFARQFTGARVEATFSRAPGLGRRPDVIAASAARLPALYRAGLVEKPEVLGSNDLTLAIPAEHYRVDGLATLGRPGVRLAIATGASAAAVSTRAVLARLAPAIRGNVRFRVASSAAVARLVRSHKADAGLAYRTDANGAGLLGIDLPDRLAHHMLYGVAVVKAAPHLRQARAFVAGLKTPGGEDALRHAGLIPGPARPR
jgi:ABC-type molybdate transport system substrate-binding protein